MTEDTRATDRQRFGSAAAEERIYHCRDCRLISKVVYILSDEELNPRLAEHGNCPRCGQPGTAVSESDLEREHPDHYGYSPLDAWFEKDVLRIWKITAQQLQAAVDAGHVKRHARARKAEPHYITADLIVAFHEPSEIDFRPDG